MPFKIKTITASGLFPDRVIALLIPLAVLLLYLSTLAPTITAEGDGAEFAACAAVGGIPHNPGYPSYMLLCRALSLVVPRQALIFGMNVMSALFGAAALGLLYGIIRTRGVPRAWAAAAALLFGAGDIYWTQCIVAEVYAPLAFVLAFLLLLLFRWEITGSDRLLPPAALLLGLGFGIHKALLPIAFLMAAYVLIKKSAVLRNIRLTAFCLFLLAAGTSVYLYLPLTARTSPAVNMENPDTFGKMFDNLVMNPLKDERTLPENMKDHNDYAGMMGSLGRHWKRQFPAAATALGMLGLAAGLVRRRRLAEDLLLLGIFLTSTVIFMFRYPFLPGSGLAHEYRVMYIPAFMVFWVGLAEGLRIAETAACSLAVRLAFPAGRYVRAALALCCTAAVGLAYAYSLPLVDKSNNYFYYDYGRNLLDSLPRSAIVCTTGDNAAFPLLYLQLVEGLRPDAAAVHLPLAGKPWYQEMVNKRAADVQFDSGPFTLESFLHMNTARRPVYACLSLGRLPSGSSFRLDPAGLVFRVQTKNAGPPAPAPYRPKHLRGVFNAAAPKDLREKSILCDYPEAALHGGNTFLKARLYEAAAGEYRHGLAYPLLPLPASRGIRLHLLNNMGVALYRLGRNDDAAEAWHEASLLDPDNTLVKQNLRRVRRKTDSGRP